MKTGPPHPRSARNAMSDPIQEGERVHLVDAKGRHYAITLRHGAVYQHSGDTLPHDDLIGKEEGRVVVLSRGKKMTLIRPTLAEYILKMPRGAQVIYPKDLSLILLWADVYPGATVLEAGMGSGALTLSLLRAVGERGRVISYEVREDFLRCALSNIETYLGKVAHHSPRLKDIYEGIEEEEIDRLILDLPEPWRVVQAAADCLRPGGIFLCYLPTVPQVVKVVEALRAHPSFVFVETVETLLRPWNIDGPSVRPDHRMVAHTGFITTARRIEPPPNHRAP